MGKRLYDLTGQKFGRLTVLGPGTTEKGTPGWECLCECGDVKVIATNSLRSGKTKSCGCYKVQGMAEHRLVDLTGMTFGKLTVIERAPNRGRTVMWRCSCSCGKETITTAEGLKGGTVKSCGCLRAEANRRRTRHGMSKSKLWDVWESMKSRCYNPNSTSYYNYGGRGISICSEWLNSFESFYSWAIDSGYHEGLSIDRIDVNGNYEPANCRWATDKEQGNNKRNSVWITHNGETHTISEWGDILGISVHTLYSRIFQHGWPEEKALTTPVRSRKCENNI